MKCYLYETGEVFQNKESAINAAKQYLQTFNPLGMRAHICYHPDTKKSIRSVGKDNYGAIWFVVGTENKENITNFVKVKIC